MRIVDVKATVVRLANLDPGIADGSQDDLLVEVLTDEGVTGIGEVDSSPEVVKAMIDAPASHSIASGLREIVVGLDPLDPEGIWEKLYRHTNYFGRRGISIHAISGLDIALWDIKGKAAGKPVSELIGTPKRTKVVAYASTLMPADPAEVVEIVDSVRTRGFKALKLGWGPLGRDPKQDVRLAAAACEAGGDEVVILIDAGLGYGGDVGTAKWVAGQLLEMNVGWLEEPFDSDAHLEYAALADATELPIACGEQEETRWGFQELIDRGRVDVVQPDVTRSGGLSEFLRIAEVAHKAGVRCVPHAWKSGIIKAASLHLCAVLPDAPYLEYCITESEINTALTTGEFPLDEEGCVAVPTAPGLGVALNHELVRRLTV